MNIDLRLGDCLEILPTLADKSVDAIITDVPYGTTACKWDVIIPLEPMWEQVKRVCKGAFVTTASQPFTSVLITSNLDWFKYEWIWEKSNGANFQSANKRPMKCHENVVVFSKNGHAYNPQMEYNENNRERKIKRRDFYEIDANGVYGKINRTSGDFSKERFPRSVLKMKSPPRNNQFVSRYNIHPTQKPVALYEYLIRTYTNAGDTVLDFCMGSGTTGVACVNTGRDFIGIEKEPTYFDIASRRIAEAQQQMIMEFA